jgi:hypothetical protein
MPQSALYLTFVHINTLSVGCLSDKSVTIM